MKEYKSMSPHEFKMYLEKNSSKIRTISWYYGFKVINSYDDIESFIHYDGSDTLENFVYFWKDELIRFIVYTNDSNTLDLIIRDHNYEHGIVDPYDCDSVDNGITAPW